MATVEGAAPATIKDLISFRLHTLADFSARSVDRRYRLKFGLRFLEWRVVALLGGCGPLTLKDLCREATLEKSHASRMVTALIARGLLRKHTHEDDQRAVRLSLTPAGRRLYRVAFAETVQRCETWLSVLTPVEQANFLHCLDRMSAQAKRMARETTALARGTKRPGNGHVETTGHGSGVLRLEPAAVRRLYDQLGALLSEGK